jgi:hypothetical protein
VGKFVLLKGEKFVGGTPTNVLFDDLFERVVWEGVMRGLRGWNGF